MVAPQDEASPRLIEVGDALQLTLRGEGAEVANVALIILAESMSKLQDPVPLQAPDQP